jgi:hypothetical protein
MRAGRVVCHGWAGLGWVRGQVGGSLEGDALTFDHPHHIPIPQGPGSEVSNRNFQQRTVAAHCSSVSQGEEGGVLFIEHGQGSRGSGGLHVGLIRVRIRVRVRPPCWSH